MKRTALAIGMMMVCGMASAKCQGPDGQWYMDGNPNCQYTTTTTVVTPQGAIVTTTQHHRSPAPVSNLAEQAAQMRADRLSRQWEIDSAAERDRWNTRREEMYRESRSTLRWPK